MDLLWWEIVTVVAASLTGGFLLARRRKGSEARAYEAGPWTGMRDSLDVTTARPDKAQSIQNAYPQDPSLGGGIVGRPGFDEITDIATGSKGQCLYNWTRPSDNAIYVIAVISGELYILNNGGGTLTVKMVTTANLTTNSITLSATARVSMVALGTKIFVTDGVNVPFQWDGSLGAGGLTSLTNCPVIYGPPTVYYSKLFGIKNTNRATFVWSEENDLTIGYEAGGYNNAWTFTQTDARPLTRLLGTNEALFVFRQDSITEVTGAVNSDFQTAGTRASVSETIGTGSPWSVVYSHRSVLFLDNVGRPHSFRLSGEVQEIWLDFRETLKTLSDHPLALEDAISVDYTPANLVLFGVRGSLQTYCSMFMVYDMASGDPVAVAVWNGYTFTAIGIITYSNAYPETMYHLGPTDGNAYRHGLPGALTWIDGSTAITHVVKCSPLGVDVSGEKFFDRMDWALGSAGNTQTNSIDYVTPRGTSTAQAPGATTSGHQALGINANARWIQPRMTHSTLGQQFEVLGVRVRGVVTTDAPTNP